MRQNRAQRRKSWYIFFFQIPWLPEALIRRGNWQAAARVLKGSSRPGTFSSDDLAQPSVDLCENGRLALIPEASHWVQHEEPAKVNRLLLDFLKSA
jgi:epoxide hydrolase 4